MTPERSPRETIAELRRNGDPRLSPADKEIIRAVTRGPELARELARQGDHDPDLDA